MTPLALIACWFLGAGPVMAASDAPASESGSIAMKPATSATLSAILGTVPSGRELELRLTDAAAMTVKFVRYDAKRELLVYRQPEVRGEFPAMVERDRIDQLRFVETVKDEGDGVIGFLVGAAIGCIAGYFIGESANTPTHGAGEIVGGAVGFIGGGAIGFVVGMSVPGGTRTGPVIWGRADD